MASSSLVHSFFSLEVDINKSGWQPLVKICQIVHEALHSQPYNDDDDDDDNIESNIV